MLGLICNFEICSSLWGEFIALLNGSEVAQDQGFRKILVHMDSELAVNMICGKFNCPSSHDHLRPVNYWRVINGIQNMSLFQ